MKMKQWVRGRHSVAFYVICIIALGAAPLVFGVAFEVLGHKCYDRMIQSNYDNNRAALLEIEAFIRTKHSIDLSIANYPQVSVVATIPHETGESYLGVDNVNIKEQWLLDSLSLMGWTSMDLARLTQLLENADCEGLRYYAPRIEGVKQGISITYRSNWLLGAWEYIVFPDSLTANQMERRPIGYRQRVKQIDPRIGWMSLN
jgi:hypothetical protein